MEKIEGIELNKILSEQIEKIEQINLGYTNKIYSINDRYILKICVNENNLMNFKRANEFCKKFVNVINCPRIIDSYINLEEKIAWQIEEKVNGENLFFRWDKLSAKEKENILFNLANELKKIHSIPVESFFEIELEKEYWKEKFKRDIRKKIDKLINKNITMDVFEKLIEYVDSNIHVLDEVKYKLCHTDIHFDNVMINEYNEIKIIDFDRLRIASIDYELDSLNVMQSNPDLIANKNIRSQIKKEAYENILDILKKEYEEMFEFNNIEKRLAIYSIKHYLSILEFAEDKARVEKILEDILEI